MKFLTVFLFVFFFWSVSAQEIDQNKSTVTFKVSSMGLNSVKGEIKGMQGKVTFSPNDLEHSYFDVYILSNTVFTNNQKRDQHLKNEDFFNVLNYPKVSFRSTSIQKTKDGYVAKGILTLMDVSKKIELPFNFDQEATTLTGSLEINRFDYNLASEAYTTSFLVGKIVDVGIQCVLKK